MKFSIKKPFNGYFNKEENIYFTKEPEILNPPIQIGKLLDFSPGKTNKSVDEIEIRLQQTSDVMNPGKIWLDWTSSAAGIINADVDEDCYIVARALNNGSPIITSANHTNYGPWLDNIVSNVDRFVGKYVHRGTIAYAQTPSDVFVICNSDEVYSDGPLASVSTYDDFPNMEAITRDGTEWVRVGGIGSTGVNNQGRNRSSTAASNQPSLCGRMSFSTSLASFAYQIPNGFYKMRFVTGDSAATITSNYIKMTDGAKDSGKIIFDFLASHSSGNLCMVASDLDENGKMYPVELSFNDINTMLLQDIDGYGFSPVFEVTEGYVSVSRGTIPGSAGTGYVVAVQFVKLAEED